MAKQAKQSTFFGGVATLAVGVIIVKLIGALYKIPLANVLGDEGNGYFTTAYNVYNVLLMISTAGLPVALSKTVSEANAVGSYNQVNRVFRVALYTFLTLGTLFTALMFLLAGPISAAIGSPGAYASMRALAPAVVFVCAMAAFRGFAQGHGDMRPTATSQVIESALKLFIGLALAYLLAEQSVELAAAGAILGVTIGAFIALLFLILNYFRSYRRSQRLSDDAPQSNGAILRTLVAIAIPITISSSVSNIVSLLDNSLVLHQLQGQGMDYQTATALYGTYGTAVNLYNLPAALMIPFTAPLIPAVAACRNRRDHKGASRVAESGMRVGMLLALPAGFGLCALAGPISAMLYPEYDLSITGPCTAILGIASIFVCIMLLCNSILQAHGLVNLPIVIAVIGGVIKLAVNYTLVGNPSIGVVGAAVGTLCCFGAVAALDLFVLHRIVPAPPRMGRIFVKPVLAAAVMGLAAWASHGLLARVLTAVGPFRSLTEGGEAVLSRLGGAVATLGGIGIGVIVYFVLIVLLQAISKDDLSLMPKGDKLAKLLRIR